MKRYVSDCVMIFIGDVTMKQVLLSEAAKKIGVSRLTLWRAIKNRELKNIRRVGRYTFVDLDEVNRWKEKRKKRKKARASGTGK
ncbi:MAG: hypothetical protein RMK89_05865 [Armatimonadota bacterium]|nr:hypothetical protein [Armatimonadota bacterium]MDW8142973.1 hypothetical protein [Armatimonadota bacterium]